MASAMRSTGGTSTTAAHPRIFARRRTVVSTAVTGVEACSMIMACLGGVCPAFPLREEADDRLGLQETRSEEHTSELQSLMRNSYAVFCLKKKIDYTSQ